MPESVKLNVGVVKATSHAVFALLAADITALVCGFALLGSGSFAAAVCFGPLKPEELSKVRMLSPCLPIKLGALCIMAQAIGQALLAWWAARPDVPGEQDAQTRRKLFDRHVVVIGAFLYMTAVAAVLSMIVALFQNTHALDPFKHATLKPVVQMRPSDVGVILAMSTALAVIGALFFIAYRLISIRDDEIIAERFSLGEFWGGLLVRCAEAVLLVFALFLILIAAQARDLPPSTTSPAAIAPSYFVLPYLPAIALLGGMLIKSFEQVIFGMADRLFKAAEVLLPPIGTSSSPSPSPSPVPPSPLDTIKTSLNGWLKTPAAKSANISATSWMVTPGVSGRPSLFWIDCASPPAASAAKAAVQTALTPALPSGILNTSVRIYDDPANARLTISVDEAALPAFAAAAAAVNPWP